MIDSKEKLKGFLMELLFSEGAARKEILEEDPALHEGNIASMHVRLQQCRQPFIFFVKKR